MGFLKQKAILMSFLVVLSIFAVYNIYPVSAQPAQQGTVCCERTMNDESCVNTNINNCDPSFAVSNSACSETQFCQPVCCSTDEGCFPSVSFSRCLQGQGQVFQDASCNSVNVCEQGCCRLGNQCSLTTDEQCIALAQPYPGLRDNDNFLENIDNEDACLALCETQDVGCCVTDDVCDYTTRELCEGNFNDGTLCSDVPLCNCESQSYKACGDDGDVYWFDSCGNKEELAEDCDLAAETVCGEVNGNVQCKSINCEATYSDDRNVHDPRIGGFRKHGEEWCLYESPTGNYTDYPGSRQYLASCVYGEEKITECRDFREEVCVFKSEEIDGQPFSSAECLDNNIYDSAVNVDVSTVPTGQEFWEIDERDNDYCENGNTECTVVWAKKHSLDDWDCEQNCECEKPEWLAQANLFCKAQGDCGADYNVMQEWSDAGLIVKWEGTTKGPRPRKIPIEIAQQWKIYGVYGGMEKLYENVEAFVLQATGSGIPSEYGTASTASLAVGTAFGGGMAAGIKLLAPLGPWGWVIAGVGIAVGFILGDGKTRTKTVKVECSAWQAPRGGDNCEKCTEEFLDCDKYKCKSLGAACEFVNEGTSEEACVNAHINDPTAPLIEPWNDVLTEGYSIQASSYGYRITPEIEPFEILTFGIKTSEAAECRISDVHTNNFDEMTDFFEDPLMRVNHERTMAYQGGKNYNFYVRCLDVVGNSNAAEYQISFVTKNEPDIKPPRIVRTSIDNGAGVSYGTREVAIELFTNEPAECRYEKEDMSFNEMPEENVGVCNTELNEDGTISGENACVFALKDIKDGQDNVWYFRCRDVAGNVNQESYRYVLKGTAPLTIADKSPEGEVFTNEPVLQVTTQGGFDNGKAVCNFKFGNFAETQFLNTDSNIHKQQLRNLVLGFYNFAIRCIDDAGNQATDNIIFQVTVDTAGPRIKYIYKDSSNLHIIMSEASTCEYGTAPFTFGQGSLMGGTDVTEHTASLGNAVYYIVCQDTNGNVGEQFVVYP